MYENNIIPFDQVINNFSNGGTRAVAIPAIYIHVSLGISLTCAIYSTRLKPMFADKSEVSSTFKELRLERNLRIPTIIRLICLSARTYVNYIEKWIQELTLGPCKSSQVSGGFRRGAPGARLLQNKVKACSFGQRK